MSYFLRLLPALVSLIASIVTWWERERARRQAREEVITEIAVQNAEILREAASEIAKHRPDDDTIDKLDKGSF